MASESTKETRKKGAAFACEPLMKKVYFLFGISNSIHNRKHLITQSLDGMGDFRRGEQEDFFFKC